jgi:hypothetical protein
LAIGYTGFPLGLKCGADVNLEGGRLLMKRDNFQPHEILLAIVSVSFYTRRPAFLAVHDLLIYIK